MKRMRKTQIIVFLLCLSVFSGCGGIFVPEQVTNRDLNRWAVSDPNTLGLQITPTPEGGVRYNYQATFSGVPENVIDFWGWEYIFLEVPVVRGQINGRAYPVVFDTGNSINAAVIEDIHIRENDLPVFLFNHCDCDNTGMALVRDFKIGPLHAKNYPCYFMKHHTKIKFLGVPVGRSRHVNIPLMLMEEFNFFEFDQIAKQIRFTSQRSFKPDDPSKWLTFPFVIKDNRILLTASLENIETTWFLDTGDGGQLEMGETLMAHLLEKKPELKKTRKRNAWSYAPYIEGMRNGKAVNIDNLLFGGHAIGKTRVNYDMQSYENEIYKGTIGFSFFKKTIMVLDFEKNLMWVKKAKGSRFEG